MHTTGPPSSSAVLAQDAGSDCRRGSGTCDAADQRHPANIPCYIPREPGDPSPRRDLVSVGQTLVRRPASCRSHGPRFILIR
jgi:hypothetical protein